jgi:hypothetical protein
MMKTALGGVVLLVLTGAAAAEEKPNFSGDWTINAAASDYGGLPLPETFTRKITHTEPAITIVEEQTGPGTTPTSTRSMTTDGKPAEVDINGARATLSASWEGSTLTATTVLEDFSLEFVDKMTLSGDGKTLTSVVTIDSPQGAVELKVVFDRQ